MLKVITLFTGIGSQEAALKRIGVDYETVGISEIDKYAIKSYEAMNGATRNYGDITKVERLDYTDLLIFSSPCQDFSLAGKQKGLIDENGEKTRSGLLFDVARLLMRMNDEHILPKYLLMENVKNLVGKKFKPAFDIWLKALDALGYNNYWKVLNAKDYGVPQNRERVFVVSIRKDIDSHGFTFPEPFKLTRRLKDVLETNVDESYYLREELVQKFVERLKARAEKKEDGDGDTDINDLNAMSEPLVAASRGRYAENPLSRESGLPTEQQLEINETGCSNTLTTVGKDNLVVEPSIKLVGNVYENNPQSGRVYDKENICLTLDCMGGGNREPKIIEDGVREPLIIQNAHGFNNGGVKEIAPALTSCGNYTQNNFVIEPIRIRKLTPKECWRLMDFTDEEFEVAQKAGVSKTQLYKQAGNSIVVSCLAHIFTNLLAGTEFEPENGFKTNWKEALVNGSSKTAEEGGD